MYNYYQNQNNIDKYAKLKKKTFLDMKLKNRQSKLQKDLSFNYQGRILNFLENSFEKKKTEIQNKIKECRIPPIRDINSSKFLYGPFKNTDNNPDLSSIQPSKFLRKLSQDNTILNDTYQDKSYQIFRKRIKQKELIPFIHFTDQKTTERLNKLKLELPKQLYSKDPQDFLNSKQDMYKFLIRSNINKIDLKKIVYPQLHEKLYFKGCQELINLNLSKNSNSNQSKNSGFQILEIENRLKNYQKQQQKEQAEQEQSINFSKILEQSGLY